MARHIRWNQFDDKPEPPRFCNVSGKRIYDSAEEATATASHQMKENQGLQLRVYRCLQCDGWHLTKS